MTVATFLQPDYNTQTGTAYPLAIDASIAVLARLAAAFAPHAQSTPNMTVRVDAGVIFNGTSITEVAAQSTGTITAPVGNPRIDRVVIDATTGAVSVITGTPAGSPAAPALTANKLPVARVLLQTSSTTITNSMITDERVTASNSAAAVAQVFQGRLTLTSGTPVTTADVTAAETIYLTPFRGNKIALYDGVNWRLHTLAEISGDVPDAAQMNDVFVYDNAGTITLDIVAWTNDTTRATALATQDGVLVKSGATGRRYVGSFYSTTAGNGQTEDSAAKRYVYNHHNRVRKQFSRIDATDSWTYTTIDVYRQANADSANKVEIVQGVSEDCVNAEVHCMARSNSASGILCGVGLGIDSSTVNSAQVRQGALPTNTAGDFPHVAAFYRGYPGIGRRELRWLEEVSGTTVTFLGDAGDVDGAVSQQSGLIGDAWF